MAIVKLNGADPVLNRFADNVRDTVNPLIDKVGMAVYTADPTATADTVGRMVIVRSPGQPSTVKVCVPNSAGGYEWIGVALSS